MLLGLRCWRAQWTLQSDESPAGATKLGCWTTAKRRPAASEDVSCPDRIAVNPAKRITTIAATAEPINWRLSTDRASPSVSVGSARTSSGVHDRMFEAWLIFPSIPWPDRLGAQPK